MGRSLSATDKTTRQSINAIKWSLSPYINKDGGWKTLWGRGPNAIFLSLASLLAGFKLCSLMLSFSILTYLTYLDSCLFSTEETFRLVVLTASSVTPSASPNNEMHFSDRTQMETGLVHPYKPHGSTLRVTPSTLARGDRTRWLSI